MFDKFKQLAQLKSLQSEIAREKFDAEKDGVKVIVNGNFMIEDIILNSDLTSEQQAIVLKDCLNQALKKAQSSAAQKMMGIM
ncbi:YbaB/EbfC family nucleoid-associated protein [Patescibacteria group bacterium]